jgi:ubiquinone/menaquinone biosynthesis C-methylase UbiE
MKGHIERIIPGTAAWDAFYANHIVRYKFAAENIRNPVRILDAACGVGYGTRHLEKVFNIPMVGVDINDDALSIANEKFSTENISFIKDNCEDLKQLAGGFSHIVSFETFEHLKNPINFLKRVHNLLLPGGSLLLSTPNASVTSPDRNVNWEFHEKEYTASELIELVLGAGFKNVRLYGEIYTPIGLLRNEFRKELNRLHHNPFIRFGKWVQKTIRGLKSNYAILPEMEEDFEIIEFKDPLTCEQLEIKGPFVLLVICEK